MSPLAIVVIILLILAIFGAPIWPYGGFGAGWYPSGGLGLLIIILLVILFLR